MHLPSGVFTVDDPLPNAGVGETKNSSRTRQGAAQYYDYIDTAKADERGIQLAANYSYNNPALQTNRNTRMLGNRAEPEAPIDEGQYLDLDKVPRGRKLGSSNLVHEEENVRSENKVPVKDETVLDTPQVQDEDNGGRKPNEVLESTCGGSKVAREIVDITTNVPSSLNLDGASVLDDTEVKEKTKESLKPEINNPPLKDQEASSPLKITKTTKPPKPSKPAFFKTSPKNSQKSPAHTVSSSKDQEASTPARMGSALTHKSPKPSKPEFSLKSGQRSPAHAVPSLRDREASTLESALMPKPPKPSKPKPELSSKSGRRSPAHTVSPKGQEATTPAKVGSALRPKPLKPSKPSPLRTSSQQIQKSPECSVASLPTAESENRGQQTHAPPFAPPAPPKTSSVIGDLSADSESKTLSNDRQTYAYVQASQFAGPAAPLAKKTERRAYAPPFASMDKNLAQSKSSLLSFKGSTEAVDGGNHMEGVKKEADTRSLCTFAPPFASQDKQLTQSKTSLTSIKGSTEAVDGAGYAGPVVPPAKHTEGIKLKDNYAYKLSKKKAKLMPSYSKPFNAGEYVGPVVAPVNHTEGIALKDNTAYKAMEDSSKQAPKKGRARKAKKQKAVNSILSKAYS